MKTCAGACDEMIPSIRHSVFVRVDSRKRIMEDQIMKLGGDRSGGTIENQANERGVQLGESNKDPLATSGCPFWYLDASLLKLGFQNKGGATPEVEPRTHARLTTACQTTD